MTATDARQIEVLSVGPRRDLIAYAVAVRSLLDRLPADAVTVRDSDERWYVDPRGEVDSP